MRTAHPDTGGSDWLAARVNMARDVLLGAGMRDRWPARDASTGRRAAT